jgi:hypothetical protein
MAMSTGEMNAKMLKFAPELMSEYARYPLHRTRWLQVSDASPKGEPCFVSSSNEGLKMHYVFGPGPRGFGYYHLLTRASYAALYARMTQESPVPLCCTCFLSKEVRREYAEFEEVEKLIYTRSRSSRPDDGSF